MDNQTAIAPVNGQKTGLTKPSKDEIRFVATDLLAFNKLLNVEPKKEWIKINNGIPYLPIRIIENELRSVFGIYQVEMIGRPQILGNSIECSVHLKVWHPMIQQWVCYAGTGAVPMQLKRPKVDRNGVEIEPGARHATDFEFLISTAIQKNAPAAMGFAISNAAKKIGRRFGSDLGNDEISGVTNTYNVQEFEI